MYLIKLPIVNVYVNKYYTHVGSGLPIAGQEETLVVATFDEGVGRVAVRLDACEANLMGSHEKYFETEPRLLFAYLQA